MSGKSSVPGASRGKLLPSNVPTTSRTPPSGRASGGKAQSAESDPRQKQPASKTATDQHLSTSKSRPETPTKSPGSPQRVSKPPSPRVARKNDHLSSRDPSAGTTPIPLRAKPHDKPDETGKRGPAVNPIKTDDTAAKDQSTSSDSGYGSKETSEKSTPPSALSASSDNKHSPGDCLYEAPTNFVMTRKIKQTIPGNAVVTCYTIDSASSKMDSSASQALIKQSVLRAPPSKYLGMITDLRGYVVVFTKPDESPLEDKIPMCGVTLRKSMTTPMHKIVSGLHTGWDSCGSTDAAHKILGMLLDQWRQAQGHRDPNIRSLGVLHLGCLPGSAQRGGKTDGRNLADVIAQYQKANPGNQRGLDTYLKGLKVQTCEKQGEALWDNNGKSRAIVGLARLADAKKSKQKMRPIVNKYGGGCNDVKFYTSARPHLPARDNKNRLPLDEVKAGYYTVAKYFEKRHAQTVQNLDLPVVNIGTRTHPTYYPPALCMLPPEDPGRKTTLTLGNVADILGMSNSQRWISDCDDRSEVRYPGLPKPIADRPANCDVGITGSSHLLPCRSRGSPPLAFANSVPVDAKSGSWSILSAPLNVEETTLGLSVFTMGRDSWAPMKDTFKGRLSTHKLKSSTEPIKHTCAPWNIANLSKGAWKDKVRPLFKGLQEKRDMILFLLPTDKKSLYHRIKRLCDQELGIHNVCIVPSKSANDRLQTCFASRSILKLNLKNGGTNQELRKADYKAIHRDSTMVVGIDTITPPQGAKAHAQGFIAMVASSNAALSQWPAVTRLNYEKRTHDIIAEMLKSRVKLWEGRNEAHQLRSIIIYIRAVPEEDSLVKVLEKEIPANIRFTVITVNKNRQAMLEPLKHSDETDNKSIIVRTMDKDKTWDFVVQGYNGKKIKKNGTTEEKRVDNTDGDAGSNDRKPPHMLPAHYSVVYDGIFYDAGARGHLENLTHDMCYLCGCSTSVVSTTLPIHYVGMVCDRVQIYVRKWYQPELKPKKKISEVIAGNIETEDKDGDKGDEEMTQQSIEVHASLKDTMFYI